MIYLINFAVHTCFIKTWLSKLELVGPEHKGPSLYRQHLQCQSYTTKEEHRSDFIKDTHWLATGCLLWVQCSAVITWSVFSSILTTDACEGKLPSKWCCFLILWCQLFITLWNRIQQVSYCSPINFTENMSALALHITRQHIMHSHPRKSPSFDRLLMLPPSGSRGRLDNSGRVCFINHHYIVSW